MCQFIPSLEQPSGKNSLVHSRGKRAQSDLFRVRDKLRVALLPGLRHFGVTVEWKFVLNEIHTIVFTSDVIMTHMSASYSCTVLIIIVLYDSE